MLITQSFKLDVKKKMVTRSARVKCVEFHQSMPWVLAGLFSGNINIYDYESQAIIKSFEVSMSPIRAA